MRMSEEARAGAAWRTPAGSWRSIGPGIPRRESFAGRPCRRTAAVRRPPPVPRRAGGGAVGAGQAAAQGGGLPRAPQLALQPPGESLDLVRAALRQGDLAQP